MKARLRMKVAANNTVDFIKNGFVLKKELYIKPCQPRDLFDTANLTLLSIILLGSLIKVNNTINYIKQIEV